MSPWSQSEKSETLLRLKSLDSGPSRDLATLWQAYRVFLMLHLLWRHILYQRNIKHQLKKGGHRDNEVVGVRLETNGGRGSSSELELSSQSAELLPTSNGWKKIPFKL
jgi:hypothetical protein